MIPISAYRLHSLVSRAGDDDLFSSDFTDEELDYRLGHMRKVPTLVAFSMNDEYVPKEVDKDALVARLVDAIAPQVQPLKIEGKHNLGDDEKAIDLFVHGVQTFLVQHVCS